MRHVTVGGQSSSAFVGMVVPGTSAAVQDRRQECAALSPSAQAVRSSAASARWVVGRAKWSTGPPCPLQQACSIRLPQRSGYLGSNCIGSHCSQRLARQASRSSSVACALHSAAGHYSHTRSSWLIHRSAQQCSHEIRVPQPFGRADSPRQAGVCGSPQTLEHTNTSVRHVKVVGQSSSAFVGMVVSGTSAVVHERKRECAALSPSAQAVRPSAASARWVVGRAKWSTGPHCPLQQACSIRLPQRTGYLGSNCIGSHCSQRLARQASRSSSVAGALHSAAGHYSHTTSIWLIPRSAQ